MNNIQRVKSGILGGTLLIIIISLVVLGIVLGVLVPSIKDGLGGISMFKQKFSGPALNYSNAFLFTAESVVPEVGSCDITSNVEGKPLQITCKKGSSVNFSVNIQNSGSKMREFTGAVIVCESGAENCCAGPVGAQGTKSQLILPTPEADSSEAGTYKFETTGKFEVYPVAICSLDATYGCYDMGITKAIKSCNPNMYVVVTVK